MGILIEKRQIDSPKGSLSGDKYEAQEENSEKYVDGQTGMSESGWFSSSWIQPGSFRSGWIQSGGFSLIFATAWFTALAISSLCSWDNAGAYTLPRRLARYMGFTKFNA